MERACLESRVAGIDKQIRITNFKRSSKVVINTRPRNLNDSEATATL